MTESIALDSIIQQNFGENIQSIHQDVDALTIEVAPGAILSVCEGLRDHPDLKFEMLIDLCGVDYLHYGMTEWETTDSTSTGYDRAVQSLRNQTGKSDWSKSRFCVAYQLLSITHNHRLRVKSFLDDIEPIIDSVVPIWNCANWYEREAFDLYGILFKGHPDLRRLLTDYGFIGHPFRKDFPLEGKVEVRYDAKKKRVIYEPVDIIPRTLVPKVIRKKEQEVED